MWLWFNFIEYNTAEGYWYNWILNYSQVIYYSGREVNSGHCTIIIVGAEMFPCALVFKNLGVPVGLRGASASAVQTKQPRKVCQEVKGGNGCPINMSKFWITRLSRSPQNGTSIKAVQKLICSLRSLHWLLAASFLNFITLLAWTQKPLW